MSNFLPNELIRRLSEQDSFNLSEFIATHEQGDKITSIRLNPNKPYPVDLQSYEKVPWCDNGYYLQERPIFTLDPFYHAGCFYVQEASSMFLDHILGYLGLKGSETRALDLCAAPGGKSTLLNTALGEDALLVSNEVIKSRSKILEDNLVRWGNPNVVATNNDPTAFSRLPGYFDLLVVDAPCSGSGMFRKDKDALDEWSLANVKLCSDRQKRILADVLPALKEEGLLIYSTCSYSVEENEEVLDWLMGEHTLESIRIPVNSEWGIEETISASRKGFGYRFYPHKVKGEGFFISVLRKKVEQPTFNQKKIKPEKSAVPKGIVEQWVQEEHAFLTVMQHDDIHIFPKAFELDLKILQQVLYLKNAGTKLGKWLGKELIPSHDLALSNNVLENLPSQGVDLEIARDFLRKKDLNIESFSGVQKGWCLVKYEGVNLGWVKVLSNRVNNYYPKELRVMHL